MKELMHTVIKRDVKAKCFGGRHYVYLKTMEKFFQALKSAGAELEFYEGTCANDIYEVDQQIKLTKKFNDSMEILNKITTKERASLDSTKSFPECRTPLGLHIKYISEQYGEYILCTNGKNKTMAEKARTNKDVLALLARDSDFLVLDIGNIQYWSSAKDHLDFDLLKTTGFNQKAMQKLFDLSDYQFHIFTSILWAIYCSDEIIDLIMPTIMENAPQQHHKSIRVIYGLSSFVKKTIFRRKDFTFSEIANMILGQHNQEFSEQIEKGFKRHHEMAEPVLVPAALMGNKFFARLWNDRPINLISNFFDLDPRPEGENTGTQTLMLAYTRAMGVYFYRLPKLKRRFMVKLSIEEPYKNVETSPVYPDCKSLF